MSNGEGHWAAIAELRATDTRHERELGTLASRSADLTEDVNKLGDEVRKTRHDLGNKISAAEGRLMKEIRNDRDASISTWRFRIMVVVPVLCVVLTFVLARG